MEQEASPAPLLELTAGLERGDDAAWVRFHRSYGPGIFRHLLTATRGDYDLASEALQNTYLKIARHARRCESEVQFGAWIRLVARSALSDCRSHRQSFFALLRRREADVTGDNPASVDLQQTALLDVALTRLNPDERALLEAKYFDGRDIRTLAAELGLTTKAVESRLTRARAALRDHLTSLLAHDER